MSQPALVKVLRQIRRDVEATAGLAARLEFEAGRLDRLIGKDGDPAWPTALVLADWASHTRCWRDHYLGIAAGHPRRPTLVGEANNAAAWVQLEDLVCMHARLITTDFAERIFHILEGMASYLERIAVVTTRCHEHVEWAAEVRCWSAVYDQVQRLHARREVDAGPGESWEDLLTHPDYVAVVTRTTTPQLATGMAGRLSAMAEFFQAEARRLTAAS